MRVRVLADAEAVLSRNAENLRAAVAEAKEWKVAADRVRG